MTDMEYQLFFLPLPLHRGNAFHLSLAEESNVEMYLGN